MAPLAGGLLLDRPRNSYCSKRRDLEQRSWALTTRLTDLTEQLMRLAGLKQPEFPSTMSQCLEVRTELKQVHRSLTTHRSEQLAAASASDGDPSFAIRAEWAVPVCGWVMPENSAPKRMPSPARSLGFSRSFTRNCRVIH
jgi:hypothetical protein